MWVRSSDKDVVRMRASLTLFVKASKRVNRDVNWCITRVGQPLELGLTPWLNEGCVNIASILTLNSS